MCILTKEGSFMSARVPSSHHRSGSEDGGRSARRKSEILQDLVQRQHRLTGKVLGGGGLLGKGDFFYGATRIKVELECRRLYKHLNN